MRFLPAAGLAATAGAFLVVPKGSVDAKDLPADARESWSRHLHLECPECPVTMPHTGEVTTQMESHLEIKFDVDLEQGNRLLFNGFQIYPDNPNYDHPLKVAHIVDMPEGANDGQGMMRGGMMRGGMMRGGMMHSGPGTMMDSVDPIGFSVSSKTTPAIQAEDKFDHISIDIRIFEVNDEPVSVPRMHVHLVKDNAGMIAISSIETDETDATKHSSAEVGHVPAKCDSWLCEWIASLENHWNHWRPHCGMGSKSRPGMSPHHVPGHHQGPHHGEHHGGMPHHGHHGEQPDQPDQPEEFPVSSPKQRTWGQLMWSVATHILLPVLIGIVAGVAMSLLGMLVGNVIVYAHRRFVHSSCPQRRMAIPKIIVHEEKNGLMDNQQPPPSYQEEASDNANNTDSKV